MSILTRYDRSLLRVPLSNNRTPEMSLQSFSHAAANVDRKELEEALDFLIRIEPEPVAFANDCARRGLDNDEEYERIQKMHAGSILAANAMIRTFGEQQPSVAAMQAIYREIIAMEKYRATEVAKSITGHNLNQAWRNINGWRR